MSVDSPFGGLYVTLFAQPNGHTDTTLTHIVASVSQTRGGETPGKKR